jgi:hypothetical protein
MNSDIMKPGFIVEDTRYGKHYAVTKVDGDTVGLRDVISKAEYTQVPKCDVFLVPGLRERA